MHLPKSRRSSSSSSSLSLILIFIVFVFDLCSAAAPNQRSSAATSWMAREPLATCGPAAKGSCCFQNLQGCPGCNSSTVEACVCKEDSRCCSDAWDSLCVFRATKTCQANCAPQCTNPCNQVSTCPGCSDQTQRECVCGRISECCSMAWSDRCVAMLISSCGGVASPSASHVPPSSTPSVSVSPSFVPPSATPSVTPTTSATPSPSPSFITPSLSSTPHAGNATGPGAPTSMAWGVAIFLLVVGCLSVSTCGAVALYYYRKKQRVEELGMPASANNRAYAHLETEDEEGLFDGAEDDEEDLPDPFAEEFVAREMEMRQFSTSPPSPRTSSSAPPPPPSSSQTAPNGSGDHFAIGTDDQEDHHHTDENELVVRDDPVDEVEEGVDLFAERD